MDGPAPLAKLLTQRSRRQVLIIILVDTCAPTHLHLRTRAPIRMCARRIDKSLCIIYHPTDILCAVFLPPPSVVNSQKESRRAHADLLENQEISTQALTPGTPFMFEIQTILEFFICQRLASKRWSEVEFELLGCTVEASSATQCSALVRRR
jgi:5'-3' exonuclease